MSKRAIVTGASSGIGWALALKLAHEGYRVGAMGRREERLQALKALAPDNVETMVADVSDVGDFAVRFEELVQRLGGLDLCVVNAGIGRRNPDLSLQPELDTVAVNVTGFVASINAAAQFFVKQGSGHIVGISSVAAFWGNKQVPAYNATKAFDLTYLKGIQANLIERGITVTDIRPGFVDTEMTRENLNMFWVATATKAADQIYEAIKKRKRVAYITKRWRYVSWLMRLIPQPLYRRFT
jgi:short-subunit dehydrogenase